jgi:hypothetical protein
VYVENEVLFPQIRTILETYANKPGFHGNIFIRAVIRDRQLRIEHWSVELPNTKQNISRRENRGGAR